MYKDTQRWFGQHPAPLNFTCASACNSKAHMELLWLFSESQSLPLVSEPQLSSTALPWDSPSTPHRTKEDAWEFLSGKLAAFQDLLFKFTPWQPFCPKNSGGWVETFSPEPQAPWAGKGPSSPQFFPLLESVVRTHMSPKARKHPPSPPPSASDISLVRRNQVSQERGQISHHPSCPCLPVLGLGPEKHWSPSYPKTQGLPHFQVTTSRMTTNGHINTIPEKSSPSPRGPNSH